jgi:hypothetical protein
LRLCPRPIEAAAAAAEFLSSALREVGIVSSH